MSCVDLTGSNWFRGVLVPDATEDVIMDPPIRFFFDGTKLTVRFVGTLEPDYDVNCTADGNKRRLDFIRDRTLTGETTHYVGVAVPFPNRANFGIVQGKFTRVKLEEDGTRTTIAGDWETEKPT